MPQPGPDKKIFSLLEVAASIQRTIAERYRSTFWVKAEMNKLNHYVHSGHCYPELLEKQGGKVIAQLKSVLWQKDYNDINARFIKVLKEPLKDGIMILFCASITFDPVHGLSLRILDIDPGFSLGELEREKQETLDRLRAEAIYDSNKRLPFPQLPRRIAIISVETSKGYADFLTVLNGNAWGYRFFHHLFPAQLQGDRSPASILAQLRRIRKVTGHFDVVAIIRGGGGDVGLSCYNNYELARELALFPLPVITGIGHSTNETVAEMISYKNAITPTELADFLIQQFHNVAVPLQRAQERIMQRARQIIREEQLKFTNAAGNFRSATNRFLSENRTLTGAAMIGTLRKGAMMVAASQRQELGHAITALQRSSANLISLGDKEITGMAQTVRSMDPVNVLKRGYSITLVNGRAVSSVSGLKAGDELRTIVARGTIHSNVQKTKANDDE